MSESISQGAIGAIESLVKKSLAPQPVTENRSDLVVVPNGFEVKNLEMYQPAPNRVRAEPLMILKDSFTGYVNKFKQVTSIVEGSLSKGVFTARLDYHYTPDQSGSNNSGPSWNTHNPKLALKLHADFVKLLTNNDKLNDQQDFVEFLEDLAHCVYSPDQATITEAVLNFQAKRNVTFQSAPNRVNGNLIFEYKDELSTIGKVSIPEVIEFAVPVYEASEPQILKAQLRYRLSGGDLMFKYVINQIDKIKRDAFDSVAEAIRQDTELPVYITE